MKMSQSVFSPGCRTDARTRPDRAAWEAGFGIGTRLGAQPGGSNSDHTRHGSHMAPSPAAPRGTQGTFAPLLAADGGVILELGRFLHGNWGKNRSLGSIGLARTWGEEMAIALSGLGRKGRRPAIMCTKFSTELDNPATAAAPANRSSEAI